MRGNFSVEKVYPAASFSVIWKGSGNRREVGFRAPFIFLADNRAGEFGGNVLGMSRGFRGIAAPAGESESQPASLQPGPGGAENRPIPPCPICICGALGGPPPSARGTPSDMRIPWLMNMADPSGPSAFSAACRQSPLSVKTPVIEATLPHPAMAARSNAGDRRYIDADASSNEVRRRADPNYSKLLYSCYLA